MGLFMWNLIFVFSFFLCGKQINRAYETELLAARLIMGQLQRLMEAAQVVVASFWVILAKVYFTIKTIRIKRFSYDEFLSKPDLMNEAQWKYIEFVRLNINLIRPILWL